MDVDGVLVVMEMNDRDNMELGMEDTEDSIEYIMEGFHNLLANLVTKIGFGIEMANASKERVCCNYFEVDMHNLDCELGSYLISG